MHTSRLPLVRTRSEWEDDGSAANDMTLNEVMGAYHRALDAAKLLEYGGVNGSSEWRAQSGGFKRGLSAGRTSISQTEGPQ